MNPEARTDFLWARCEGCVERYDPIWRYCPACGTVPTKDTDTSGITARRAPARAVGLGTHRSIKAFSHSDFPELLQNPSAIGIFPLGTIC
jgi:hypothetical protein